MSEGTVPGDAATYWRLAGEALAWFAEAIPGSESVVGDDGWLSISGGPVPDTNMAAVLPGRGLDRERQAALVGEFVRRARDHGVPLLVPVPRDIPDDVPQSLGLLPVGTIPLMARDVRSMAGSAPDDRGMVVRQVHRDAEIAVCRSLVTAAFGLPGGALDGYLTTRSIGRPGAALFLAQRDGQPLATVTAVRTRDAVGLRFMATAPAAQRQGVGRAVLDDVCARNAAEGVSVVYLASTEAGIPLYRGAGFVVVDEAPVWVAMPGGSPAGGLAGG